MTISTAQLPLANRDNSQTVELELVGANEKSRRDIERFIQTIFHNSHGARINHFLPYLLSMHQNNKMLAALGIRPAAEGELFLEAYLDKPVENSLAERLQRPIDRSRIVEVGNLASAHGGGARALMVTLTAYLKGAGYEWAVFTATPKVRNNFAKLGIELTPIVAADRSRLADTQSEWGSYYDHKPVVVIANIVDDAEKLCQALQHLFPTAQQLWDDAYNAGRSGILWQPPRTLNGQWPEWTLEDQHDFSI